MSNNFLQDKIAQKVPFHTHLLITHVCTMPFYDDNDNSANNCSVVLSGKIVWFN